MPRCEYCACVFKAHCVVAYRCVVYMSAPYADMYAAVRLVVVGLKAKFSSGYAYLQSAPKSPDAP